MSHNNQLLEASESEDIEDEDDSPQVIRGKWIYDGCSTIAEMRARLLEQEKNLAALEEKGGKLESAVEDDYAFITVP